MYLPIEEAVEELRRRQKNKALVQRVNEFLGDCPIPRGLNGFLARHIAAPTFEAVFFEERCRKAGLHPIALEFTGDAFVTNNPEKLLLVRLRVFWGYGKRGGPRLETIYVVERRDLPTIPLSRILTRWGEPLVDFHHRGREMVGLTGRAIDLSSWLKSIGPAKEYYKYLLAACVVAGILFDLFDDPEFPSLDKFKSDVVMPAYEWVKSEFGCSPLIVEHPDASCPERGDWYPPEVIRAIPPEYLPQPLRRKMEEGI